MNVKSSIESILFLHGESVSVSRLSKLAAASKKDVAAALQELASDYRERGIVLIQNREEWQLVTNPENKEAVEKFSTSDLADDLSKAGLEVLAIIAYKGPVSRAGIEYIRGVDSSFSLRNLLIRGLVEREENPKDRRSFIYRVSIQFLKHLGVAGPRTLPHYEEFRRKEKEIEAPEQVGIQ